jgi:uncharacterized protein YjiS (DUF1127 family)
MSIKTADFAVSVIAPAPATPVVARIVRAGLDWVRRRHSIRVHRRILHSLPDRVLSDIGISRGMIDHVVPERLDHAGRPAGPYPF